MNRVKMASKGLQETPDHRVLTDSPELMGLMVFPANLEIREATEQTGSRDNLVQMAFATSQAKKTKKLFEKF